MALFKNGIIERSRPGITTPCSGVKPNHELPNIGSTGVRTIQVGSPSKVGTLPSRRRNPVDDHHINWDRQQAADLLRVVRVSPSGFASPPSSPNNCRGQASGERIQINQIGRLALTRRFSMAAFCQARTAFCKNKLGNASWCTH